jgi:hypothetical protein
MPRIGYILILILFALSCEKEDDINSYIFLDNKHTILSKICSQFENVSILDIDSSNDLGVYTSWKIILDSISDGTYSIKKNSRSAIKLSIFNSFSEEYSVGEKGIQIKIFNIDKVRNSLDLELNGELQNRNGLVITLNSLVIRRIPRKEHHNVKKPYLKVFFDGSLEICEDYQQLIRYQKFNYTTSTIYYSLTFNEKLDEVLSFDCSNAFLVRNYFILDCEEFICNDLDLNITSHNSSMTVGNFKGDFTCIYRIDPNETKVKLENGYFEMYWN